MCTVLCPNRLWKSMFQSPFLRPFVEQERHFSEVSPILFGFLESAFFSITCVPLHRLLCHHHHLLFCTFFYRFLPGCLSIPSIPTRVTLLGKLLSSLSQLQRFVVRQLQSVPFAGCREGFLQFVFIFGTLGDCHNTTYQSTHCSLYPLFRSSVFH